MTRTQIGASPTGPTTNVAVAGYLPYSGVYGNTIASDPAGSGSLTDRTLSTCYACNEGAVPLFNPADPTSGHGATMAATRTRPMRICFVPFTPGVRRSCAGIEPVTVLLGRISVFVFMF